jgi:hypothetical protein
MMDTGSMTTGTGSLPAPQGPGTTVPGPAIHSPGLRRTAILLGSGIVLLAAVALVLVATTSRPPAEFAADSPEHAFQMYLVAWDTNDLDGAYAQFSDRVKAGLSLAEYRDMARGWGYESGIERRVVLLDSTVNGDRATLELRVDEQSGGGLFGGDSVWSRPLTVDIVRDGDAWHLDQAMVDLEPIWHEK